MVKQPSVEQIHSSLLWLQTQGLVLPTSSYKKADNTKVEVGKKTDVLKDVSSTLKVNSQTNIAQTFHSSDYKKIATDMVAKCSSIQELCDAIGNYKALDICKSSKTVVLPQGSEQAEVMIISDVPQREDDRTGNLFTDSAGIMLNKVFDALNLQKSDLYLTNISYWRPPGDRKLNNMEIDALLPFLQRAISIVKPAIIVTLGADVSKVVTNVDKSISKLRGNWIDYEYKDVKEIEQKALLMPVFHPNYLIATPISKKQFWLDFLAISSKMDEIKNNA